MMIEKKINQGDDFFLKKTSIKMIILITIQTRSWMSESIMANRVLWEL